jgi:tetratricopeptide (TPR) repeat protein
VEETSGGDGAASVCDGNDGLQQRLDLAELSLNAGAAESALGEAEAVVDALERPSALWTAAQLVRASALAALGRTHEAVDALRQTVALGPHDRKWVHAATLLVSYVREIGDFDASIAAGEEVIDDLRRDGLAHTDEAVQLRVTIAATYFERGDVHHATRMCRRAAEQAERDGSERACAAAYWNTSIMEGRLGHLSSAIELAQHALALVESQHEHMWATQLRSQLGAFLLRLSPPDPTTALEVLERASRDYAYSRAPSADLGHHRVTLAQARLMTGDPDGALAALTDVLAAGPQNQPIVYAGGLVVQGRVLARAGDPAGARRAYVGAITVLTGIGADRRTAQLWLDLGGLLADLGDAEGATDAYRRAAVAGGVQLPR